MISVRVAFGDIECELAFDSDHYSPDVVDDLTQRASGSVIGVHTVIAQQQAETEQA